MGYFVAFIVFIVGIFVAMGFMASRAKNGLIISLHNKPYESVVETVEKSFIRLFWDDVPGMGLINKRRRVNYQGVAVGPVISVKIHEIGDHEIQVETFMSEWTSALFGLVVHGVNLAFFQNKKIIKRVSQL